MKVDTTINIRKEILERIDDAAIDFSVSRSRLISLLIKKKLRAINTDKNRFSRVKYQPRDKKAQWKRPHVYLETDLYEKCIDMRKLLKLSVSYIILVAYNQYFHIVLEELQNNGDHDNNMRHYICIGKKCEYVFSYTVFWDYPSEDELTKVLE